MIIEVRLSGVPEGAYPAEFRRAEEFTSVESVAKGYKPGIKLIWVSLSGAFAAQETSRICGMAFGQDAELPKFIRALFGRDGAPGEQLNFDSVIGTRGIVIVETSPTGRGTRVATFVREAPPAAAPAPVLTVAPPAAPPSVPVNPPF